MSDEHVNVLADELNERQKAMLLKAMMEHDDPEEAIREVREATREEWVKLASVNHE